MTLSHDLHRRAGWKSLRRSLGFVDAVYKEQLLPDADEENLSVGLSKVNLVKVYLSITGRFALSL